MLLWDILLNKWFWLVAGALISFFSLGYSLKWQGFWESRLGKKYLVQGYLYNVEDNWRYCPNCGGGVLFAHK